MTDDIEEQSARRVVTGFRIEGELARLEAHRRGHIHDTFISTWLHSGDERRFLHQRINRDVFPDVPGLMNNIECVTRHLRASEAGGRALQTLELVPARDGAVYAEAESSVWRTYHYIEGTESHDLCAGSEQAFEAARAFGWFQARLTDLDPAELCETIPRFFSSPYRLEQLDQAIAADSVGRVASSGREIDFARQRREMVGVVEDRLADGRWPQRVVHGDTKLNNILFDVSTGQPRSIVDLDTCMPGYSLYDFGDLVRFTAATAGEDETDLDRVEMDLKLYRALAGGYLESASEFLLPDEVDHMPFAARLVTLTIGLRFLADHLAGDVYLKVAREGHNLDRARVQFKLVESMERQAAEM